MKIANIELLKDRWVYFLKSLFSLQGQVSKKFNTERYCKCDGLDVKLVLKLDGSFDFREEQKDCIASFHIALSTDCMSLRKSNYFWSDKESYTINYIIFPEQHLDIQFEKLVDEIMYKMDFFKICNICRILYQEHRVENSNETVCMHCMFDSIFYVRDTVCVICNDNVREGEQTFTLTCGHTFHSPCILQYFIKTSKRECPLCRESDNHQM